MTANEPIYAYNRIEAGADFWMDVCLDPFNARLRVDDYRGAVGSVCRRIQEIAALYAFTKNIVKARAEHIPQFLAHGYMIEAVFYRYFNGSDAYGMTLYTSGARRTSLYWLAEDEDLRRVLQLPYRMEKEDLPSGYTVRAASAADAEALAQLYDTVFQTYPTPMNEAAYIRKVMEAGTIFYVAENAGRIVSAASAEVNGTYHNAEITDCATYVEHRKYGLMRHLVRALEAELRQRHLYCVYSLARSLSFGMNAVFHQLGYMYSGRMANNCNIYDKLEDMSVWVKDISVSDSVRGGRNE